MEQNKSDMKDPGLILVQHIISEHTRYKKIHTDKYQKDYKIISLERFYLPQKCL